MQCWILAEENLNMQQLQISQEEKPANEKKWIILNQIVSMEFSRQRVIFLAPQILRAASRELWTIARKR